MSRSLNWRSLSGGLIAFVAILGAALLVLVYARVGRLHGRVIDIYIVSRDAQGIIPGSEVWLAGQKVGLVKDVSFRSANAPLDTRLLVHAHLLASVTSQIRIDSRAQIRPGGTVLGDPVVYLQAGHPGSRAIAEGDTLYVEQRTVITKTMSAATAAAAHLPEIMANIKATARDSREASTRFAGLTSAGGAAAHAMQAATELRTRLDTRNGSAGQLLANRTLLLSRATQTMSRVDSIRTLLTSQTTTIGRFRRDSSLVRNVAHARDDLADIARLATAADGTLPRLRTDSVLLAGVDSARAQMANLLADMKAHPFRYIYIF